MIKVLLGKERIDINFIEWRPQEGLILRVANEAPLEIICELGPALYQALRGSPHAIYRTCCDSTPGCEHAEGCGKVAGCAS